jgi:glycosyltransferase involved in cell wall biosynthesis
VNVTGYITSEKAVGEAVRSDIRSLEAAKIPCALNNFIDPESVGREDTHTSFSEDNPYGVNLVHINAVELANFLRHKGERYFRGCYNIGYWVWELSDFPREWVSSFRYFDEIWVPSNFVLDAISRVAPIPVIRIPHSLSDVPERGAYGRMHYGIPQGKLTFLFMFDFHSFMERKNPLGLIRAFRKAFRPDDDALLVLKCSHATPAQLQALREASAGADVRIIDRILSRAEVNDLVEASDFYVSLHRSEGFGLTMAEAMSMGKPVIATGYSGNMDFMTPANSFLVKHRLVEIERSHGPYKKGCMWADPDIDHAAELMRFVYENRERAMEVGQLARQDLLHAFHPRAVGKLMKDRLLKLATFGHITVPQTTLEVPAPTADDRPASADRLRYEHLVHRIRAVVRSQVPQSTTVAVVSKGDEELLRLGEGRRGWHFPQNSSGVYAGHYPADSADAVAQVEALRTRGAHYLLFPATALWWLEHYEGLRRHLEDNYRRVKCDGCCVLYELSGARGGLLGRALRLFTGGRKIGKSGSPPPASAD